MAARKGKAVRYITLLGKRWRLVIEPMRGDYDGLCSDPHEPNRTIHIHSGLSDEEFLRVFLHETHHGGDWPKCEEWVDQISTDQARELIRLGFHRRSE